MAYTNAMLPFATDPSANVLSGSSYYALTARTLGFQAGVAPSAAVNCPLRQANFTGAMIGQFTADFGTANVVDDGNIPAYEANFESALLNYLGDFLVQNLSTTNFYINASTGSDTLYDGTQANVIPGTVHGPWSTLQGGYNHLVASQYAIPGASVNVYVAAGAYSGLAIAASSIGSWIWTFASGATITQASGGVSNGRGIQIYNAVVMLITPQFTSTYQENVNVSGSSNVQINGGTFVACAQHINYSTIYCVNGAFMYVYGAINYSGNAIGMFSVGTGAQINVGSATPLINASCVFTFSGTPTWTNGFVVQDFYGDFQVTPSQTTFTGAVHGPRYWQGSLSIIYVYGSGTSYLPGNAAGYNDGTCLYG